ncbi:Rossmann-like and DUF2520 domain-containing protein [Albirhodobacter sp. R86504]|uniref:Rossmann-like and DUF2520 domain-containing protein n=1 Tax=Albirhodobacter sp. R86504 TaxID=3093848 RepID=UPI0036728EAE
MLTINIIGAGAVGRTIGRLIVREGVGTIQDIHNRSQETAQNAASFIQSGRVCATIKRMRPADLWLLSVSDGQIASAAHALAQAGHPAAAAVHFSGFLASSELAPLSAQGWSCASLHPVLSFAEPARALEAFKGSLCGVEGDEPAAALVQRVFTPLGARCFHVETASKGLYHAAAVFTSNFTTVLQAVAREAWAQAGVEDAIAKDMQASLLASTVTNLAALGPQAALTGPAARGDGDVVARQSQQVSNWHPDAGRAYDLLSEMAKRLKATGQTLDVE